MKILLGTPLLDGRADREFINGLLDCQGLYYGWAITDGVSHICVARDMLAAQFLASDCDQLVFVDSDIGFGRSDLEQLTNADAHLVGGLYTRKASGSGWLFSPEQGEPADLERDAGVKRVRHVGTGFLRIDRAVFEDLQRQGSCPTYRMKGMNLHHFFQSGVRNGQFLTEDYFFCELARAAGHFTHVHTHVRLRHIGKQSFSRD